MTKPKIFKPIEDDIIFYNGKIQVYKKGSGEVGSYPPSDMFGFIDLGLSGLKEWANAGLKYKKDLVRIFDGFRKDMDKILEEFKEE